MEIQTKRVYDPEAPDDGTRVLVDRVWPRGISKERARADLWMKNAAPSPELRKWFGHDPKKWTAFKKRYFSELESNEGSRDLLDRHAGKDLHSCIQLVTRNTIRQLHLRNTYFSMRAKNNIWPEYPQYARTRRHGCPRCTRTGSEVVFTGIMEKKQCDNTVGVSVTE